MITVREIEMVGRSFLRVGIVALLLCACPAWFPQPGLACDDTVLMIVSGANPGDEFSGNLLKMARSLRDMASALNAFNVEAAGKSLGSALETWVAFDNRYSQNPPYRWKGDPRWTGRVKQVTDLLGVVRGHFQAGRYDPAHDMLEGVVIQMSLLGTGAFGAREYEPVLEAEWLVNMLNPSLPGAERTALIDGLSSFSVKVDTLKTALGSDTKPVLDDLSHRTARLREEFVKTPTVATPLQLKGFADLLADFTRLKSMIWQRPQP